jgi:hypothetical protein
MNEEIVLPALSKDLIDKLDKLYPDKCPLLTDDDRMGKVRSTVSYNSATIKCQSYSISSVFPSMTSPPLLHRLTLHLVLVPYQHVVLIPLPTHRTHWLCQVLLLLGTRRVH